MRNKYGNVLLLLTQGVGWRAQLNPKDHPLSEFEFDVIIGADGKRNTLQGMNGNNGYKWVPARIEVDIGWEERHSTRYKWV